MGKRRRLRKSGGGELEVNMQDVASDEVILPSVAELEVNMQDVASDEAIFSKCCCGRCDDCFAICCWRR
jgi:hypothetical protein